MKEFSFFIQGVPAPGGSKTFFPVWRAGGKLVIQMKNGREWPIIRVVDDAGDGNKRWREAVTLQARSFMRGAKPFTGPVKCEFVFFLRRPKSHYRTGKFATLLREDAPRFHDHRPDALKFGRSTEDALTEVLWADDAQTVRVCSEKRWMNAGDQEGCAVRLVLLEVDQLSLT